MAVALMCWTLFVHSCRYIKVQNISHHCAECCNYVILHRCMLLSLPIPCPSQACCWTWSWSALWRQWCVGAGQHITAWTCSPPFLWTATPFRLATPPEPPCAAVSCWHTWCWLHRCESSSCCGPAWWGWAGCFWAGTMWLTSCLVSGWAIASTTCWRCCGFHLKPCKGCWDNYFKIKNSSMRCLWHLTYTICFSYRHTVHSGSTVRCLKKGALPHIWPLVWW